MIGITGMSYALYRHCVPPRPVQGG